MRIVISGIIFSLLIFGGFLIVKRLPAVQGYRECYTLAYQVIDNRGIMLRTGDTNAALCETRKGILIRSGVCFDQVEAEQQIAQGEGAVLNRLARMMAKGNKSFDELVDDHNQGCSDVRQQVRYDTFTGEWF